MRRLTPFLILLTACGSASETQSGGALTIDVRADGSTDLEQLRATVHERAKPLVQHAHVSVLVSRLEAILRVAPATPMRHVADVARVLAEERVWRLVLQVDGGPAVPWHLPIDQSYPIASAQKHLVVRVGIEQANAGPRYRLGDRTSTRAADITTWLRDAERTQRPEGGDSYGMIVARDETPVAAVAAALERFVGERFKEVFVEILRGPLRTGVSVTIDPLEEEEESPCGSDDR